MTCASLQTKKKHHTLTAYGHHEYQIAQVLAPRNCSQDRREVYTYTNSWRVCNTVRFMLIKCATTPSPKLNAPPSPLTQQFAKGYGSSCPDTWVHEFLRAVLNNGVDLETSSAHTPVSYSFYAHISQNGITDNTNSNLQLACKDSKCDSEAPKRK